MHLDFVWKTLNILVFPAASNCNDPLKKSVTVISKFVLTIITFLSNNLFIEYCSFAVLVPRADLIGSK